MDKLRVSLFAIVVLFVFMFSYPCANADIITGSASASIGNISISLSTPNAIVDYTGYYGQYAGYPQAYVSAWENGSTVNSKRIHDATGSVTTTVGVNTATAGTSDIWPIGKNYLLTSTLILDTDSTVWSTASTQENSIYGASAIAFTSRRFVFYTVAPVTVTFTLPYEILSMGYSGALVVAEISGYGYSDHAECSIDGSGLLSVSQDYASGQLVHFTYFIESYAGVGELPIPPAIFLFGSGFIGLVGLRGKFKK